MPKPPLIHFPGALFHITARGNNKQDVFHQEKDFARYLLNIKKCKEELPFYLYALVLMPNHIHLLVEVIKSPIDKIMQKLQTAYTMYANKKYETVGHLFQGRYFSLLVEKESYLLELIRYIHLNPVRAGIAKDPAYYPWSSYKAYLGLDEPTAKIVDYDRALPYFSSDPKRAVKNYTEFVLSGRDQKWEDFATKIKRGQILGSTKFVRSVERKLSRLDRPSNIFKVQP